MKELFIAFIALEDVCYPDYFQGLPGKYICLNVRVDGKTRCGELKNYLWDELQQCEELAEYSDKEILQALNRCFQSVDLRRTFDKSLPIGEEIECYAYFSVEKIEG